MSSFLFDTCFLIDLEREMRRGPGKAHQFLKANLAVRACLSWTVAGEFAEGFGDIHHPACAAMLARFDVLPMDQATAHHYAVITRQLRGSNQLIGTNDLWIASAALAHAMPLVSNNISHFGRVPHLAVVRY
ncbi:MAG: type II toxin-antitoxin system VapC family toxin [Akkermansiaceae bacterium]|nr:type II toxin-antitoxin system VapC family toxin [Akkermansiaceae bacterium]NJR43284.1 type II toxin-antitoxin system VapC family toxin [Akkermansiaceae bacterium]